MVRQARAYYPQPASLELGWNIRAQYAFFSIYVFRFSRSLDTVTAFYSKARVLDPLSATVEATSLAFMAMQLNSKQLMGLASGSYVTAIQRLGLALSELKDSEAENTLLSVLFLDMFEKMVNRNPRGSPSWMTHAQGGLCLLGAHQKKFVSSLAGSKLAARLVTALTVSCAAAAVRVPHALRALRHDIDIFVSSTKWSFTGILASIVDLQADVYNAEGICRLDFVERAVLLDDQLQSLGLTLPPSWKPRRIPTTGDDPRIFGCYYNVYQDHYITQVSNAIHAMRLVLDKIIRCHASEGDDSILKAGAPVDEIHGIAYQICASVPQFILPGAHPDNTLPFSPLQRLQCHTLLTPLYFVHQVSSNLLLRDWVKRCLRYMWEIGSMEIAKSLADEMEADPNLDYWVVYAKVGSYAFAA